MSSKDNDLATAQKALQSGDFAGGLELANKVLESAPDDGEALYIGLSPAGISNRQIKPPRC